MTEKELKAIVVDVPDFPKQGIIFKDISGLLSTNEIRSDVVDKLTQPYQGKRIDVVAGIESRGFLFGMLLAQKLKAKFIMIRKPGKLPGPILKTSYELEYGTDSLEIQEKSIKEDDVVLLHDDVLATGGTAAAAISLLKEAGASKVYANFVLELGFLDGRKQFSETTHSILKY